MKKIAVIGTGYVGLVTGTCFAELGNDVICVDIDEHKVNGLRKGTIPIYEPGLEELFLRNCAENRLSFTTSLAEAVKEAEAVFLALPTPPGEDGSADLSYILSVANKLGPLLDHYVVVVDKSTVPVGTSEQVRRNIARGATVPFDVVSNPEFLREGFAVADFMKPSRVIVGAKSAKAREMMQDLYAPIIDESHPIFFMNERSAELTKYAANSFLAMKITFMNQIANMCELMGADVDAVRQGVGSDDRIGSRFLYPGIGYGGSCFPKDVIALIHTGQQYGYELKLLEAVVELNKEQQQVLVKKVLRYYDGNLVGKTFALWGLAFKPDTDDIREAPALGIIDALTKAGATIRAYDPEAMDNVHSYFGKNRRVTLVNDEFEALKDADALLIATEWHQFRSVSPERIKKLLVAPVIFDGRNIFTEESMRQADFYYESIGRPIIKPESAISASINA